MYEIKLHYTPINKFHSPTYNKLKKKHRAKITLKNIKRKLFLSKKCDYSLFLYLNPI